MKIQDKDMFHGAALTQIVEHPSFKALNKADEKQGHYQINHDRKLHIKLTTKTAPPWQFTFTKNDLSAIQKDIEANNKTFICLVCGNVTVCPIDSAEIIQLLNLDGNGNQWIRVETPAGGSLWVHGSAGDLKPSVPHNSFPGKVFK